MNRLARFREARSGARRAIIPTIGAAFALCLLLASPALCRDAPAREDVVRAMLDRSRLLEDIHVEVPVALWREYLRDQLAADAGDPPAPVAMIAERGLYRLNVGKGGAATMSAGIRLRIFQPGKCRNFPVLSARRAWKKITINGKPAKLATRGGWVRFSPAEPGVYEISAESQLLAFVAGVENSLALPIPRTVRTLVDFESSGAWEVWVAGESARIRGLATGGTKGVLALTPRSRLELRCGPVRIERERPPRYRLRGQVAWNLDAGRQQVVARIDVRILGGRTDRLDLSLPAAADRVRIIGPDVRDVQVRGGSAAVFLRGRVGGRTSLDVRYELPAGKSGVKRFSAPTIRDGSWTGGTLVVTHTLGGSELLAASADGLKAIDLTEIPPSASAILTAPAVLAYRITSRKFSAGVEVLNLGEFALRESIADLAHYEVALSRDGTMLCKVRYEVRNRSKQFLRLTLPRGAKVLLARVNEKPSPITPVGGASGAFLLPLVRSKASVKGLVSFPVEVVYIARLPALPGGRELSLPLPRVDLPIAYAWCELYSPRELSASRWSGQMRRVERYSTETARTQLGYGRGQLAEGFAETARMKPGEAPKPTPMGVIGLDHQEFYAKDRSAFMSRSKLIPPAEAEPATRPTFFAVLKGGKTSASEVQSSLARNYWRAGKDLYEKGDYKKADEAFGNVIKLAPKSVEAANAARLSSNIRMLSGKLALRTKSEKAGAMQARREIEEQARELTGKQRTLLERSAKAAGEGRYRQATRQYKAAEALSGEIIARGGKIERQRDLLEQTRSQLAAGQEQLQEQAEQTHASYRKLRAEGQYEQAREELSRLRDIDDDGVLHGGGIRIRKELEELAVLSARKRTKDATKDREEAAGMFRLKPAPEMDERAAMPATQPAYRGTGDGGREHRIAVLERRARTLISEHKYSQALRKLEQMLKLDPKNRYASERKDLLENFVLLQQQRLEKPLRDERKITGTITAVISAEDVASINIGSAGGVRKGMNLAIHRGGKLVGILRVEDVEAAQSAGLVLAKWADLRPGDRIVAGDSDLLENFALLQRERDYDKLQMREEQKTLVDIRGTEVPWHTLLRHPQDWKELTTHRKVFGVKTPKGDRDVRGMFSVVHDRFEFRGNKLEDVIGFLRDISGTTIVPKWNVLESAGVTPETKVNLPPLLNVSAGRCLKAVLESLGEIGYAVHDGTVIVSTNDDLSKPTVMRTYDIRDLTFEPQEFDDQRDGDDDDSWGDDDDDDAKEGQAARQEIVNKLRSLITETVDPDSWADSRGQLDVSEYNGRLIVRQTPGNQRQIEQLLAQLREARGPQVERGANIARQQASGLSVDNGVNYISSGGHVAGLAELVDMERESGVRIFSTQGGSTYDYSYQTGYRGTPDADRLREYIKRNYKWQLKRPAGGVSRVYVETGSLIQVDSLIQPGGVERPRRGQAVFAVTPGQLVERMRSNLGQDVQVSSRNIYLPADVARALGAKFVTGNNNVRYAVVDEAQVRTLREIEAKNRSGTAAPGTARWNTQRAFVGTDALLANSFAANVAFAGDKGNGLNVYDNPIALPHEKFILLDNNGYITAVKADPMRHWTDTAEFTPPAEVPQTIDVPRVGRMVKFEKTLVDPADGLVIRVTYTWKGDAK